MLTGSINFTGLASGLDTAAMIEAILGVERRPLERMQEQQAQYGSEKAALGELQSKLNEFESKLRDLSSASTFRSRTATVSDTSVMRVTAGTNAEMGLFSIEVNSLAAAHKVKSDGLAASDQGLVTDGTITIQSGDNDAIDITVSSTDGNNTMEAIRDAINAEDAGVQASIIFDGSDYRMIVRSEETGVDNALVITDNTNLNLDLGGNQVQAAADASLTIDGVDVSSSSNTVTSVIPGATLELLDETEVGDPISVELAHDIDKTAEAVRELVSSYNGIVDFFNLQFNKDNPGPLDGNSTARRLQTRLQTLVTGGLDGKPLGSIRSLSSIGIDFDGRTGKMSLDSAELRDLLDTNFDDVADLFLASGTGSHNKIQYVSALSDTVPGEYAIEVTQAAEQATVAGSTALDAGGITQDETLTIQVGSDSVDVALTTGQTLSQIIDTVNAALRDNDVEATALDDGGLLRITSRDFGSSTSVSVTSDRVDPGDGTGTGFTTTAATDDGVDVAGSIGGVAATGSGQILTAADGDDYEGLVVRVTATANDITTTGGDFGTMSYSKGLMKTLLSSVDQMTRFGDGTIDVAREALTSTIERLATDVENLEYRLELREAQLIYSFTEAERAISLLNSQQAAFGASL